MNKSRPGSYSRHSPTGKIVSIELYLPSYNHVIIRYYARTPFQN